MRELSDEILDLAEDIQHNAEDLASMLQDLTEAYNTVQKLRKMVIEFNRYCPAEDYGKILDWQSVYGREHFNPEDAEAPFFSEAILYNIFGKEAARIVLARWNEIRRTLGVYDECDEG